MATTSEVRRENVAAIRHLLWQGGLLSKKDIAAELGLSVASCNTLLNDMAAAGEVTAEPHRTGNVGRSGLCYRAAEGCASIAAIFIDLEGDERIFRAKTLSLTGTVLDSLDKDLPRLDAKTLLELIDEASRLRENVRQIVLGVPGTVQAGAIDHCDVAELDGADIATAVAARIGIPLHIENDMHLKAAGYCHEHCGKDDVTTLANFPAHVLPGTATIHAGEPIRGAHGFAGMIGFIPYSEDGSPLDRRRLVELLAPATCRPLIAKGVATLCAVLNPSVVVLTGNLLDKSCTTWLREACAKTLPEEFLPELRFEETFDRYYLIGMHQTALSYLERTL